MINVVIYIEYKQGQQVKYPFCEWLTIIINFLLIGKSYSLSKYTFFKLKHMYILKNTLNVNKNINYNDCN